ncbi:IclR family transcriptional regulator [Nitratireductor sp. XY-223]|uniref:IclR family transcriptional regulator n=1 Tax=Nitratireductor sp. XY-223 TaxID=2561926 RepID=UPI0010AABDD9|nr:IclR family transcriptional regulator [Nitratireductor sp. XY-223]
MTAKSENQTNPLFIESLARSFQVLELFSGDRSAISMSEIRNMTGLTFQTIHRITNTLIHLGYLQRQSQGKTFRLTVKTLDLQHRFLSSNRLTKLAWPVLVELRERTHQRVSFCGLDSPDIIYLLRLKGAESDFQTSLVGGRQPAFLSAGGLAILAFMSQDRQLEMLERHIGEHRQANTSADRDALASDLAQTKKLGYCVSQTHALAGEIDVAVPVSSPDGTVSNSIVVSALLQTHPEEVIHRDIIPAMQIAARGCTL